jgi:hypothetical protein
MPESRIRRKSVYKAPQAKNPGPQQNGRFFLPIMLGLFILGLAWIVVYYLSRGAYPIPGLDNWNLVVGFGIVIAGFVMTTRWR